MPWVSRSFNLWMYAYSLSKMYVCSRVIFADFQGGYKFEVIRKYLFQIISLACTKLMYTMIEFKMAADDQFFCFDKWCPQLFMSRSHIWYRDAEWVKITVIYFIHNSFWVTILLFLVDTLLNLQFIMKSSHTWQFQTVMIQYKTAVWWWF